MNIEREDQVSNQRGEKSPFFFWKDLKKKKKIFAIF